MNQQQNASPVPEADPGLRGCDRDIFLRVWHRVMPEERADCPITVPRPEAAGGDFPALEDLPCLGVGGAEDLERLQEFTAHELACGRAYRLLARRAGPGGRTLSALAGNCRRRAKRLSAALFLLSGVRYWPAEQGTVLPPRSYFGALREHFLAEQNRECAYRAAQEDCQDECLRALYTDLAEECAEHARQIRSLLETM